MAAGWWVGRAGGHPLVLGAPGGYFLQLPRRLIAATTAVAAGAILADTMIPEAFEGSPNFSGLITVAGFRAAFMLSNYQEPLMLARPRRSRVTWRSWPR